MEQPKSFAELLRGYREAAGLSQEELAERAGLTAGAVGALERGQRRHPYPHTVRALASALELSNDRRTAFMTTPKRGDAARALPAANGAVTLPLPESPLVGREREVVELRELLGGTGTRLLTLTGPGGVGKTRLAVQVATEITGNYRDGVAFVPVASISDPTLVVPTIGLALGLREAASRTLGDALRGYLREKHLLLVLDNFEHLMAAAPELADLLVVCPEITLLVTSRAPLHLHREQEYPVPPLVLPDLSRIPTQDDVAASPAAQLFIQRARKVSPSFALTDANAAAVAVICRRLDGLPLALELAAAWVKLLPPTALLARLDRALPLLSGGPRDMPARQQTMRATVAWSFGLLSDAEQALIRRLSVFTGGFVLEAAEAVTTAAGEPGVSVLEGVAALLDKSLLHREDVPTADTAANPRFGMLETVREYAHEQLEASGEAAATHQAHTAYFLELAERAEPGMQGPDERAWLAHLDSEYDNFRAALAWAEEHAEIETLLCLGSSLFWFWFSRHGGEGRGWLDRSLAAGGEVSPTVRARALHVAGALAWWTRGDNERAEALMEESLAILQRLGDKSGSAHLLHQLGHLAWWRHDFNRIALWSEEGLRLAREVNATGTIAGCLDNLAVAARAGGDGDTARALLTEALILYRGMGRRWSIASALGTLAALERDRGELTAALSLYHESIVLNRDEADAPSSLRRPGQWAVAEALGGAAIVAVEAGCWEPASRLFGAAERRRESIGFPVAPPRQAEYRCAVGRLRTALAAASLSAEWAVGRILSIDQIIDELTALIAAGMQSAVSTNPLMVATTAPVLPADLSAREAEVRSADGAGQPGDLRARSERGPRGAE